MQVWKISDVGVSRSDSPNEDTFLIQPLADGAMLAAVCDGMGGASAGEVASATAASAFGSAFVEGYDKWDVERIKELMRRCVDEANRAVFDKAMAQIGLMGMGTTIVAAAAEPNGRVVLANVGDSRGYLLNDDGIKQVTTDHSLVNEMIERGELTRVEAQRHPSRNLITRAIGVEPEVACDTYTLEAKKGDYILLCSDGLNDQVSEPEIYYEVWESGHPELACRSLVEVANARGGSDNITIILISI